MSMLDKDDLSPDPVRWSWAKLCDEVEKRNPLAEAEYEDRLKTLE